MHNQAEVREFLRTRRARLTPQRAGIIGGRRRVPGLRREEVALLAGVSVDYYAKMERGILAGVSPDVLDAVARALQLDEAETEHLHDLARAAGPLRRRSRPTTTTVRPSRQRLLDAITGAPAWVGNSRKDTLATNALGRALLAPMLDDSASGGNNARFKGLELPDSPGWVLYAYTTIAGSPTEERLQLLGSLAATRTGSSAAEN